MEVNREAYAYGVGLDVGTSMIVRARKLKSGNVEYLSQRDSFLEIEPVSELNRKMIQKSLDARQAFYLYKDNKFYIVGQHSISVANERGVNVERPLKQGVLSAKDKNSFPMLAKILEVLVGPPLVDREKCYFSFPADPIDAEFDSIYHQRIIGTILDNMGYEATPILEAEALGYSELLDEGLTGMALSFGAGQTNCAILHLGSVVLSASVARGGDWIDKKVAEKLDLADTTVQAEKEGGISLINPDGKIQEAIAIYYDNLINYVCDKLKYKFSITRGIPKFKEPITVVISGGTTLCEGFDSKIEVALRERHFEQFGIQIGAIKKASDPLTAVSGGCLIASEI